MFRDSLEMSPEAEDGAAEGADASQARTGAETAILGILEVCGWNQRSPTRTTSHPQPSWNQTAPAALLGHQLCERYMRGLVPEDKPHNYPRLPANSIHGSDKPSWAGGAPAHRHLRGGPVLLTSAALCLRQKPRPYHTSTGRGPSLEKT